MDDFKPPTHPNPKLAVNTSISLVPSTSTPISLKPLSPDYSEFGIAKVFWVDPTWDAITAGSTPFVHAVSIKHHVPNNTSVSDFVGEQV